MEKNINSKKFTDHCPLTGKYRGPAHEKCKINVTQKESNFISFFIHKFSIYDCHLFVRKLNKTIRDKVELDPIPKINGECISVTYRYTRLIDSYRFLPSGSDSLVKTRVNNKQRILKKLKKEIDEVDNIGIVDKKNKKIDYQV